jgi:hypothetical protein
METNAGARERGGFIDAPDTGPANSASRAITDPTATPAMTPFSLAPVETLRITNIKKTTLLGGGSACRIRRAMFVTPGPGPGARASGPAFLVHLALRRHAAGR